MNTSTRWWLLVNTSHVSYLYKTPRPTAVEIPFRKNSCNFRECCHSPDHNLKVTWTPEKYLTDLKRSNVQTRKFYQIGNHKQIATITLNNFSSLLRQCVCRYCCYSNLKMQTLTSRTSVGTFIYILKAKKRKPLLNAAFWKIGANEEDGCIDVIDQSHSGKRWVNAWMTRGSRCMSGGTDRQFEDGWKERKTNRWELFWGNVCSESSRS